ncbi:TetR family transcriptional regulator [Pusillimonas sp. TS35]|uniref:TetR/AcrR family transcriptional regulator n=1 Tax=Paracandidimonas lactea TaxID=2895524 RepID=UPI00136D60F5|nr:TetR/AcrR family transcriptional regulator [Paracandidimonas lactea]MYN13606.1 TetR family transcriptional regulator [Pusillimonas sp. TS35]
MIGDFESFKAGLSLSQTEICRALYRQNPDLIRIKKEHVAVRNLVRIIDSTLKLTRRNGFHAMSLRDLSADTGMSIGGLYAYIRGKEDLIYLIQHHGIHLTRRTLLDYTQNIADPCERLHAGIKAHVYLSELLQPWFYFSFMEAKNLPEPHKKEAIAVELEVEGILRDIIADGMAAGVFRAVDAGLLAALCKAMMQDWYLKRRKYTTYQVDATGYAAFICGVLDRYLAP